jgi:hypothetical protein
MDGFAGGPILQFLRRLAEIFQNLAVKKLDLSCRTQRHTCPGMVSTIRRRLLFIRPECLLGTFPLFKISVRSVLLNESSCCVSKRTRTEEEPAIFSVETAETRFDLTGFPGGQQVSPIIQPAPVAGPTYSAAARLKFRLPSE